MGNDTKEKASLYIGRGFLQLTGYNNVRAFASDMRVPEVLSNPTLLEEDYAMETAIWFFRKNNLWKICDEGVSDDVIKKLTKRINGGYTGLDHRIKETNKIYEWVKA
jgi:putative chitinase